MRIVKFRVKDFKSVQDSGYCYIDEKITILAGRNESGKTSLLEALEDFNVNKSIRKEAIPIFGNDLKPEIELYIRCSEAEVVKLLEYLKVEGISAQELEFGIRKKYPNNYEFTEDGIDQIHELVKNKFEEAETDIRKMSNAIKDTLSNFPGFDDINENLQQFISSLSVLPLQFTKELPEDEKKKTADTLNSIKQLCLNTSVIRKQYGNVLEFIRKNLLPNVILFSTFDDILPDQKAISEAKNIPIIKDLIAISGLNLDLVQSTSDARERVKHQKTINMKVRDEYKTFWSQNDSHLYFDTESNNIYFYVEEGNEIYRPGMRSKGKQWYLSFYIRITARAREERQNVLLIDEPGLYLHAEAQKDVLKKLEDCCKSSQILYSTHSPYLIPSDKLNRLRLVIKSDGKGTQVVKLTAKADKETLTPILTAIGEDLSVGIKVDKKNSIVLEGITDYLILNSFKKLLNVRENFNFIPSVGGNNVPHVGSILFGWGLDPVFVLDNDSKGNEVKGQLIEELSISEKNIIMIPNPKEGEIEDLFSQNDLKIFYDKGKTTKEKGKHLTAIQFYQKVEKGELSNSSFEDETKKNFGAVFEALNKVLKQ